jgi:hypothetical protein
VGVELPPPEDRLPLLQKRLLSLDIILAVKAGIGQCFRLALTVFPRPAGEHVESGFGGVDGGLQHLQRKP